MCFFIFAFYFGFVETRLVFMSHVSVVKIKMTLFFYIFFLANTFNEYSPSIHVKEIYNRETETQFAYNFYARQLAHKVAKHKTQLKMLIGMWYKGVTQR